MIFFYVILGILLVLSFHPAKSGFNEDYICKEQCNVVKGVFIWIVFLRHIIPYILQQVEFVDMLDIAGHNVDMYFRQLLVAPFLFYSGFGVLTSIKKRGGMVIHC